MNRIVLIAVAALLLAGAVGLHALSPRAEADTERQVLKVGVIDVKGVFDSYTKKQELEDQMAARNKLLNEQGQAKKDELQKLQRDIEFYTEGSDERQKAEDDFGKKELEFKAFLDKSARALERDYRDSIASLYKDITEVIQTYGRERQFDLILKIDKPDLTVKNPRELQFQINNHKLLYGDGSLDITDEIIARLAEKTG